VPQHELAAVCRAERRVDQRAELVLDGARVVGADLPHAGTAIVREIEPAPSEPYDQKWTGTRRPLGSAGGKHSRNHLSISATATSSLAAILAYAVPPRRVTSAMPCSPNSGSRSSRADCSLCIRAVVSACGRTVSSDSDGAGQLAWAVCAIPRSNTSAANCESPM